MYLNNPFVIEGYVSPTYFCDRVDETATMIRHLTNGCNVALIAQRRIGKSGLIHNVFYQEEIKRVYETFYVDIYETKNLNEFVYELGRTILNALKPKGRRAWEEFLSIIRSLQHSITFNADGTPVWSVKIGEIVQPDVTLDEIFHYLSNSERPCIVAIDEFQVIADYPEKTVEATLRKRIQNCHNARFIYSGSKRHMMAEIFVSASRPFYNSCAIMGLDSVRADLYLDFANHHLAKNARSICKDAFMHLYSRFDGLTWYIQFVLNMLYTMPTNKVEFDIEDVDNAVSTIITNNEFLYKSLLYQLTTKQKQLLFAISEEKEAESILSSQFLKRYNFSASTVQTAINLLLDRDFVTKEENRYSVYDKFFDIWLRKIIYGSATKITL